MAVCPIIAALIFTYREKGPDGVKSLLARIFDYKSWSGYAIDPLQERLGPLGASPC
jgi:hypothetical protein